jgi:iron complex transport system substrate-binding protein
MGQPRIGRIAAAITICVLAGLVLQKHHKQQKLLHKFASAPAVRVASITPAGTDLLIGMGAANDLVGVSNFDDEREGTAGKPRIGDYQSIDWEKLSAVDANALLVQYAADRMPGYVKQQCAAMGIRVVNLKLDTVAEICQAMEMLGGVVRETDAGTMAAVKLRGQLDEIAQSVKGLPKVRALVVTSDQDFSLAGPGEFLDELLTISGGENAAKGLGEAYPAVDREMIVKMSPEVIIRLVPDGDQKPQVVEQGDKIWAGMTDVPAVRNHRVYVVTEWYCEMPGFRVGEIAEKFAECLHGNR